MNKQQLSEALLMDQFGQGADRTYKDWEAIHAAARLVERLLPGECESCEGTRLAFFRGEQVACPVCHGSGRVWDEGIVEAVAKVLNQVRERVVFRPEEDAHAVLSAIAELLTEKAGSQ